MKQRRYFLAKTNEHTQKVVRFGDLIAAVYERCGKASANGLLRLAVNAHLVVFPEGPRFMIVKRQYGGSRF